MVLLGITELFLGSSGVFLRSTGVFLRSLRKLWDLWAAQELLSAEMCPKSEHRNTEQMGSSSESPDPLPATDVGSDLGQPLPSKDADFRLLPKCLLLWNPCKGFSVHATPGTEEPGRDSALLCTCSWIGMVLHHKPTPAVWRAWPRSHQTRSQLKYGFFLLFWFFFSK